MTAMAKAASSTRAPKRLTRQSLASIGGVVAEMASLYRRMKAGKLDHKDGRSLVWVLDRLRAAVEAEALQRIEAKLDAVAEMAGGYDGVKEHHRPALPVH
jgi:hypothetical protein